MTPAFHTLAAVAVPLTLAPSFKMAPPPIKPMPVIKPLQQTRLVSAPRLVPEQQQESAARHSDNRKCAYARAVCLPFALPSERSR